MLAERSKRDVSPTDPDKIIDPMVIHFIEAMRGRYRGCTVCKSTVDTFLRLTDTAAYTVAVDWLYFHGERYA